MNVAVIGDIFCDILVSNLKDLPHWGQDTLSEISILPGGSALNTTVHAANYSRYRGTNVSICLFSATGSDLQGQICRQILQNDKIIDATLTKDSRTGSCIVLSGADRAFISDRGCIDEMRSEWFGDLKLSERNVCHLHCAGYYNCTAMRDSWPTLFQTAKQSGLTTSLNPQYDATQQWDGIQELCPYIDILFCNEMEAAALTKENDLERSAEVLLSFGCKYVVITQSSLGCTVFYYQANEQSQYQDRHLASVHQSAFAVESPIDSTGAGDAFVGGFLVEWAASGRDLNSSLRAGCLAGAGAVTQIGGSTVPDSSVLAGYDTSAPLHG